MAAHEWPRCEFCGTEAPELLGHPFPDNRPDEMPVQDAKGREFCNAECRAAYALREHPEQREAMHQLYRALQAGIQALRPELQEMLEGELLDAPIQYTGKQAAHPRYLTPNELATALGNLLDQMGPADDEPRWVQQIEQEKAQG